MKTLTIRLPDLLMKQIEQESLARRVSKSDIVRERLAALPPARQEEHPLADILEESWKAKVPAGPPRFPSPHKQRLAEAIRAKKLHRR
jgi:hypothetical protein